MVASSNQLGFHLELVSVGNVGVGVQGGSCNDNLFLFLFSTVSHRINYGLLVHYYSQLAKESLHLRHQLGPAHNRKLIVKGFFKAERLDCSF